MRKSEEFLQHAHKMVDFIAEYYKQIETFPVLIKSTPTTSATVSPELHHTFPNR
jgi:hypothetical protein